jgi:hypothetical protein
VPLAAIPPSSEARQLLFDTRRLLLTTSRLSPGEQGEHDPNMRLNPCRLCFRDQLLGLFPSVLFAVIDHHVLPDDDRYFSVYSRAPVCIPRMEACL